MVAVGVNSGRAMVGVWVSIGIAVSVGVVGAEVGGGAGVIWITPSSTRACAVSSMTVGKYSSGINVGGILDGRTLHPAAMKMMNIKLNRERIDGFMLLV